MNRRKCGHRLGIGLHTIHSHGKDASPLPTTRETCQAADTADPPRRLGDHPLELIAPLDHERRGSHISYKHREGYTVMAALIVRGIIGDYREPHVLHFGITPLYVGFTDVWDAVDALFGVLENRLWDTPESRIRRRATAHQARNIQHDRAQIQDRRPMMRAPQAPLALTLPKG